MVSWSLSGVGWIDHETEEVCVHTARDRCEMRKSREATQRVTVASASLWVRVVLQPHHRILLRDGDILLPAYRFGSRRGAVTR